ncbi:MAG: hypothetical protein LBU14_06580 [Candidatus Peribacteria bacterium]|nr:hypothetical protein [Candidatus Peribacteria bacterium]
MIPLIFIFLPFKNKYYFVFFVFLAFLQIIFYVMPTSKLIDNENLKQFDKSVLSGVTI